MTLLIGVLKNEVSPLLLERWLKKIKGRKLVRHASYCRADRNKCFLIFLALLLPFFLALLIPDLKAKILISTILGFIALIALMMLGVSQMTFWTRCRPAFHSPAYDKIFALQCHRLRELLHCRVGLLDEKTLKEKSATHLIELCKRALIVGEISALIPQKGRTLEEQHENPESGHIKIDVLEMEKNSKDFKEWLDAFLMAHSLFLQFDLVDQDCNHYMAIASQERTKSV